MTDFTVVLGVDAHHLKELEVAWQTWKKHKPSLFKQPIIIFYDREQLRGWEVTDFIDCPGSVQIIPWPSAATKYPGTPGDKWSDPQRHKMLAGFVHVPAAYVKTPYWLKLDSDTVATRGPDDWIDREWFCSDPAIVAHRWGFTKPPNQMVVLDEWAEASSIQFATGPLNMHPELGASRLGHNRIISWCGFFSTALTRFASASAVCTCGPCLLPVCSQDGFMWYVAQRADRPVVRTNMKDKGWSHASSSRKLLEMAGESLNGAQ